MANDIIRRKWNQNVLVSIEDLSGSIFQAESGGHTFEISGVDNYGNTVALSGTVAGVFMRSDNTDVAITGTASGGIVTVTLPAECYDVPGRFGLTVFVTADSKKTAIYAAIGTVRRTSSGNVAPGTTADVVDLINAINAAVATIPQSWSGLMADIAPTYSTSAVYPVGAYVYYDGDLYRCTTAITTAESWTAAHWTAAVLGNDVSDLKSALNNNSDFFLVPETFETTFTRSAAINPETGENGTVGFRTGYIEYDKPMTIKFNKAGETFIVWVYSNNSTSNAQYCPLKAYTQGVLYIPFLTGTKHIIRIGFHKDSGEIYTEEEAAASFAEVVFRSQTDETLLLENVPADAKETGDRLQALASDVGAVKSGIAALNQKIAGTTIRSYALAEDYTGADYTVISDKKPGNNGWVNDSNMLTILIPDDGTVNRVTIFRNNAVYSCNDDGKIVSTWASESVADSSASYGQKPNGDRADYIAFILTKTHIANDSYNTIVTNTGNFYTPFVEKGLTIRFDGDGKLVGDYTLKLPDFALGNIYANGNPIASTTRSVAPWMYIPKGTVIDTSCTAVDLMIYGVSATEYIHVLTDAYIAAGRRYTFANDTYAVIRYDVGTWARTEAAPTLSAPTQAQYFIRYILPEEIAKNPWFGKTWRSYGTSISDIGVNEAAGNNGSVGQWPLSVDALSGMSRYNGAIGSGSIMPGSTSHGNIKAAILQCPFDVDLVTLELGPNDNYWDYLGEVGDTTDDTFLGNLYQIYDYLTKNTRALVVFVGIGARNLTGNTSTIEPANGTYRTRYRRLMKAVKELSDLFGIPVIDADANACNLNRRIKGVVMRDYIHYTYLGGEIYGRYVWSQLKDMRPYFKFAE